MPFRARRACLYWLELQCVHPKGLLDSLSFKSAALSTFWQCSACAWFCAHAHVCVRVYCSCEHNRMIICSSQSSTGFQTHIFTLLHNSAWILLVNIIKKKSFKFHIWSQKKKKKSCVCVREIERGREGETDRGGGPVCMTVCACMCVVFNGLIPFRVGQRCSCPSGTEGDKALRASRDNFTEAQKKYIYMKSRPDPLAPRVAPNLSQRAESSAPLFSLSLSRKLLCVYSRKVPHSICECGDLREKENTSTAHSLLC